MLLDVDELKLRLRRQRIVPDRFCNFFTDIIFLVVHNCQNIDISLGSGQANILAQGHHQLSGKVDENKSFYPNQSAPSIYIMIELCYFSLVQ